MSEQLPVAGDGAQDPTQGRAPRDPRIVKTILAGAAGVAVLGGGALAFVWLGSAPGADASALGVGGGVTAPAPSVTTAPSSTGDSAFAASGRDIFAATVAPTTASSVGEAASGTSTGSSGSASSGTLNSVISFGSGSKSGSSSSPSVSASTKPSATPTSSSGPSASATPTSEVPWTAPDVKFLGASADSASFWVRDELMSVDRGKTIGQTTTVFDSFATVATTEIVEDLNGNKTEQPSTDGYGVFRAGQGLLQGWMLKNPVGTDPVPVQLPSAAVGNTQGTIRIYEVGNYGPTNGSGARISVNGAAPVYVKTGGSIPGTDFSYMPDGAVEAFATTTISKSRSDVAVVMDGTGRIYFGLIGAGEDAGIRY